MTVKTSDIHDNEYYHDNLLSPTNYVDNYNLLLQTFRNM